MSIEDKKFHGVVLTFCDRMCFFSTFPVDLILVEEEGGTDT